MKKFEKFSLCVRLVAGMLDYENLTKEEEKRCLRQIIKLQKQTK